MTSEKAYTEALHRIVEAQQTGATELGLSGLGLAEIPAELLQCINLQSLDLRGNQISRIEKNLPAGLQSLDLGGNQISQIENLPAGLQSLTLGDDQISRIENLPARLQSLTLGNNQISQLENLPAGAKPEFGE